jgi:hypothetical protein
MILKEHKNRLLTIIQESGFDPGLFTTQPETIANEEFFAIHLRNSSIRFALRPYGDFNTFQFYQSTFTPGFYFTGPYGYYHPKDLYAKFENWLNTVVRPHLDELNAPDLWQALQDTLSVPTGQKQSPLDLEPFSEDEKVQLRVSIERLRLSISNNFNLQSKQLATVNKLLKHLSDALDKHSRFDWRGIAINVAVTIALHLALNPDQTKQLFQLFKDVFSNVIHLLP